MNAQSFTEYLKNPSKLYQINYQELKSLALQYPYCQNLQWLLLQKSQMDGHKDADANLEKTATLSVDRKVLFQKMKKTLASLRSNSNYSVVDEVLELPNLNDFRRPEPILREPFTTVPLENHTTLFLQENGPKPFVPKEEETLDISKLQVPPKPLDLPEISPDPMPISPDTPEIPQPDDPAQMPIHPSPEIPNPNDPAPVLPTEKPDEPQIEASRSPAIEWEIPPKNVVVPPPATLRTAASPARAYQPPVLVLNMVANPPKLKEAQVTAMVENSVTEKEELVSETLASILAKQGHYAKAIKMYEQLILKFPGKSDNFAAQIQKLKQL